MCRARPHLGAVHTQTTVQENFEPAEGYELKQNLRTKHYSDCKYQHKARKWVHTLITFHL